MPQMQLLFFPEGVTHITPLLAFRQEAGRIVYFNGSMPVFVQDEADLASCRMITAPFCVNSNSKQAEIAQAFGVAKISLKRAVKRYRAEGPKGFYVPPKGRTRGVGRGPAVARRRLGDLGGRRARGGEARHLVQGRARRASAQAGKKTLASR